MMYIYIWICNRDIQFRSFTWWKPEVLPRDSWISGDGAHSKAVRAYDEAVDPVVKVSD